MNEEEDFTSTDVAIGSDAGVDWDAEWEAEVDAATYGEDGWVPPPGFEAVVAELSAAADAELARGQPWQEFAAGPGAGGDARAARPHLIE